MKLNEFFLQSAVFMVDELDRFLSLRGSVKTNTRKSFLTYHRDQGRIKPVLRGLYATVLSLNLKDKIIISLPHKAFKKSSVYSLIIYDNTFRN
jgi:hypothetical protein